MPLPARVRFEGVSLGWPYGRPADKLAYRIVGRRPPLKGEYYLSGAIVQAWRAPNDLTTAFIVVEPIGLPPGPPLKPVPFEVAP